MSQRDQVSLQKNTKKPSLLTVEDQPCFDVVKSAFGGPITDDLAMNRFGGAASLVLITQID